MKVSVRHLIIPGLSTLFLLNVISDEMHLMQHINARMKVESEAFDASVLDTATGASSPPAAVASPVVTNLTCLKKSGYNFHAWNPNTNFTWRVMSTVQIEKSQPSGFASRCDWVIGSRPVHWKMVKANTAWGNVGRLPRTIFLQTDELQKFNDRVLPCFPASHRFVIIIGDHDRTTPQQVDVRYNSPTLNNEDWQAWLADERILHLFVEHLDTPSPSNRVTPIPLGLNPVEHENSNPDVLYNAAPASVQFSGRPIRMVFTNRVREGPQWQDRADASQMCARLPHCDLMTSVEESEYVASIQQYAFLLCVHGGGIDPNPNLFTALLAGVIPIMAPFPGQSAYDGLPILITDGNWNESSPFFSEDYLLQKAKEFAPYLEDPAKRAHVLERLSSKYWWDKVIQQLASA